MSTLEYIIDGSILSGVFSLISTPDAYLGAGTYIAARRLVNVSFKAATIFTTLAFIGGWMWKNKRISALVVLLVTILAVLPGCASGPKLPENENEEYYSSSSIYGGDYCQDERRRFKNLHRLIIDCKADHGLKSKECQGLIASWESSKWSYRSCRDHHIDTNLLTHPANLFRK